MGTQNKTITVKHSVCLEIPSHPPIEVPRVVLGQIFDKLMTAQRLALVLDRIGAKGDPATLLAWEMFLAISSACETLGTLAGYSPNELEPE